MSSAQPTTTQKGNAVVRALIIEFMLMCLLVIVLYAQESQIMAWASSQAPHDFRQTLLELFRQQRGWLWLGEAWRLWLPCGTAFIVLLIPSRLRWWSYAFLGLLVSAFLTANQIYFRFFSTFLGWKSLALFGQGWQVRDSFFHELGWSAMIAPVIIIGAAIIGHKTLSIRSPKNRLSFRKVDWVFACLFFAIALQSSVLARRLSNIEDIPVHMEEPQSQERFILPHQSSPREFALTLGLINYFAHSGLQRWSHKPRQISPGELSFATDLMTHIKSLNDQTSPLHGVANDRNLVMVSIEAFQYFLFDLVVDGVEITPVLNRLRRQSLSSDYFLDDIALGGTSDAEFGVLAGLLPDNRSVAALSYPENLDLVALPETLRDLGYQTISIHANDADFWNRRANHPALGFTDMWFRERYKQHATLGMGPNDLDVLRQTAQELSVNDRFFAYVISLSSHHPYPDAPQPYAFASLKDAPNIQQYLNICHYVDAALGSFLDEMSAVHDNTMFVFFGDHAGPGIQDEYAQMQALTGVNLASMRAYRMPFIIWLPGQEEQVMQQQAQFSQSLASYQDVFPTVLHLLGADIPLGIFGTHLFVPMEDRLAYPLNRHDIVAWRQQLFSPQGKLLYDEKGPVFVSPGDITQAQVLEAVYQQSADSLLFNRLIFDGNIQGQIIEQVGNAPRL